MKNTFTHNMLKLALITALSVMVNAGNAQAWMNRFADSVAPGFFEIQKSFNTYWNAKGLDMTDRDQMDDDEDGAYGEYIQYKRWEWFASRRVSPTGELPNPMIAYLERNKIELQDKQRTDKKALLSASWTSIGPVTIPTKGGEGRVNCVAVNPLDTNTIYVGSPSGGLWKTTNGGTTWTPTSDYLATLGVTDIAIDPVDTSIIYIATGDGDVIYTYSTGVMKSTNGGAIWNTTGLSWQITQGLYMNKIVINPNNHNMIMVGNYNGIAKSLNGGATWTNSMTGHRIYDIQFKPGNSGIVYACNYRSIYKSTDSGSTFTTVYNASGTNRLQLAVTPANANYLYALESDSATSGFHALIRSTDGGVTFTQMSNSPNVLGASPLGSTAGGQGWADLALAASPKLANTIFIGGINIWSSDNGGTTWINKSKGTTLHTNPSFVHADIHKLVFMPGNATSILAGCDGGLFKSEDTGTAWTDLSAGLTIMEMYNISSSQTNNAIVSCGVQDNGSDLLNTGAWSEDQSGDGMMTIVDYTNASTIYTATYGGKISITTNGGTSFTVITPNSGSVTGAWVTPYVIDKNTNTTLYAGYNDIWKTTNQGTTWTKVTNNLTGTATDLVMAMAISPSNSNYLYAAMGASDGYNEIPGTFLFKTTDAGTTWSNVTGTLPIASAYITNLAIKASDPLTVWVTFSGYNASYKVYKTIDGGTTWTNVSTGLPNVPVDCIVYDETSNNDRVFVGTDVGVFYTDNTQGGNWLSFNTGLPNVMVYSLDIQQSGGLLRAGTFGRGLWETQLTSPLSINTIANDNSSVKVYPNPSNGKFSVEIKNYELKTTNVALYNMLGQEACAPFTIDHSQFTIDLSNQSSGVYFLKVGNTFTKLVKE